MVNIVTYIVPEGSSSSRREAANRRPTVRLKLLCSVFLIFRGVDAIDKSSSNIWPYTSKRISKSAGACSLK